MQSWTDEQLADFQAAHDWQTARPIADGRILGKGKAGARKDSRHELVRERLGEGLRVLEPGSHEGQHTVGLAAISREVIAVEVRPRNVVGALIRQLVNGVRNVQNIVADVKDLPPDLGRFDLIFHCGLLYHLPDPIEHLFAIAPLGDALLLDTHYATDDLGPNFSPDTVTWRGRAVPTRIYKEPGWATTFAGTQAIARWLYRDELLALVAEAGFPEIEVYRDERERNGPRIGLLARRSAALTPGEARR